jgi:tetratricopeptide (TPR) repeat protein
MTQAAVIAGAIVLVALAGSAQAGSPQNAQARAWCMNKQRSLLDQQITGCTILIETKKKQKNLGRLYDTRGIAHFRKGQYELAIADYDRAVALGYGAALYHRSLAKEKLGDRIGAGADLGAFRQSQNSGH